MLSAIFYFVITIIKLIVIIGIVTTIHEFGHFLFAKLFKMGVNEFSIGFGPKIFQKKIKETYYSIRCIPLGGFCAIEGEGGDSTREDSFTKKNVFQKIIVLVMGATFNAIFAIAIFLFVAFSATTYNTKITNFTENSVLEQAGVKTGDTINSIDGKNISLFSQVLNYKVDEKNPVEVEYTRDGQKNKVTIQDAIKDIGYIGISFKISEDNTYGTNIVDMVASGNSALEAGIKSGDKIISIDGLTTSTSNDIVEIVKQNPNKTLDFEIERNSEIIHANVTPSAKLGFDLGIALTEEVNTTLPLAITSSFENAKNIVGSYVDLFRGKVGVKDMSGIVGIGEVVSKTNGFLDFINLIGIISLAIGAANLMPFPPLDGGKVVIVICETITRKKLSMKAEAIISYIGFGALILLTIVVTYNDIMRIF